MREAHLAGPRHPTPTADQRRDRRRMVRRAKRRHPNEAAARLQDAGHRMDARHLERGFVVQERQDPRQPSREHRLPRAGRPGEQQVVAAGRGDLERTARTLLTPHVGQVGHDRERFEVVGRQRRCGRVALAAQVGHGLGEMTHADRLDSRERHLGAGLGGADEMREAGAPGPFGRDERARHRPKPPVERELADRGVPFERFRRHLVGGGEHGERDRQVEARPLLAQRGRCEVDRDAPLRGPLELGRRDSRAHSFLRLLARPVGEADDRERRQPPLEVRLDLDAARVDADERVGDRACEHRPTLGGGKLRVCAGVAPRVDQLIHMRARAWSAPDGGTKPSRTRCRQRTTLPTTQGLPKASGRSQAQNGVCCVSISFECAERTARSVGIAPDRYGIVTSAPRARSRSTRPPGGRCDGSRGAGSSAPA